MRETKKSSDNPKRELLQARKELKLAAKLLADREKLNSKLAFELSERTKELECQNKITLLLYDPLLSNESIYTQVVSSIPAAFQFPGKASAYLKISGREYKSPGFKNSKDSLEVKFKISGFPDCLLKVCCKFKTNEKPKRIFLKEEKNLLLNISQRLAHFAERSESRESLKDKNEQFENILTHINDAIYEISVTGIILYISPAIEKILGYKPKELTGKNFFNFVYEADKPGLAQSFARLEDHDYATVQHRLKGKKGKVVWVQTTTAPVYENGKLAGRTGTLTDITERKKMETDLKASEKLSGDFLEASPDLIAITDLKGKILFVSQKAVDVFGVEDKNYFIGRTLDVFTTPSELNRTSKDLRNRLSGQLSEPREYKGLRPDGTEIVMEVTGSFIRDEHGDPVKMIFVARDITQKKLLENKIRENETLYKSIINASPDGISITDLQGNVQYSSPRALEMFGAESIGEIHNRNLLEFIHPDSHEKAISNISEMLKGNLQGADEYKGLKSDGTVFDIEVNGEFIRDDAGNPQKMIYVTRDISARKFIEDKLRDSEENYRKMVESVNEVLYEVDVQGIITYVSPVIVNILGYTPLELTGTKFFNYLYPEEIPLFLGAIGELGAVDAAGTSFEYRFVHKNGNIIWVRCSPSPVFENGVMTGHRGILTDINDKELAAQELRRQTRLQQLLMKISNTYINLAFDDLDAAVNNSLKEIGEFISADRFYIFNYDFEKGTTSNTYEWCAEGIEPQMEDLQDVPLEAIPDWVSTHKKGGSLLIPDVSALEAGSPLRELLEPQEIKSLLAVPLMDGTDCRGFAGFDSVRKLHAFSDSETNLLRVFTQMLSSVNKRFETERILVENENRFRNLFENMAQGVVYQNASGFITDANPAAEKILGLTLDQMQGRASADARWRAIHEDGSDFPGQTHPAIVSLQTGEPVMNVVMGVYHPVDNRYVWILVSAEPQFKNGEEKPYQVFATFTDITESKNAALQLEENRRFLADLIENSGSLIYVKSINGRYISVNAMWEKITGLSSENTLGRTDTELFGSTDAEEFIENDRLAMESDAPITMEEVMNTPSGPRYFLTIKFPIIDSNGEKTGLCGMSTEITERKLAEKNLRENEEQLRNLVNSQTSFVIRTDLQGRHTYWNRKYEEVFGWIFDRSDIAAADSLTSICSHHHQRTREAVEKCILNPGTIVKVELDKPATDGSIRSTLWEFVCLTDSNNVPVGLQCMGIDITERVRAEVELKDSNRRSLAIMNSMEAFIYISDMQTYELLFVNEYGKKSWGENITGQKCYKALQGKDSPCEFCTNPKLLNAAGHPAEPVIWEFQNLVNGRWYDIHDRAIPWSDGKIVRMEVATDVTERKEAELKIRQSEENYRKLFFESPDGYLLIHEGKFFECNRVSEELIRGSRAQIIGKSPDEISPEYQPNGKLSTVYSAELISETMEKGRNTFEWVHTRFDGTEFIAQISLSTMDYQGKPVLFTTWQDITERKKAEEEIRKLSRAIEQSPVSILITNLDGEIEYANAAALTTSGYSLEELMGVNPKILQSGNTPSDEYVKLWHNITEGREWRGIFHNRKKDGTLYWESSTVSPILNSDGIPAHYLAVKEDITGSMQIQEALRKSEKRFSEVAAYSRTVIWEVDINGLYTFVSDTGELVYGYRPDELTGKFHFYDLHPEEMREAFKAKGLEIVQNGLDLKDFDNPVLRKDGRVIWVSTNGTAIYDDKKKLIGYRGADIDITDRKNAEEELRKFRIISDRANIGNVISDIDGNLLYVNEHFAQMHEMKISELIGKHLSVCHTTEQLGRVGEVLEVLFKEGRFEAQEIWQAKKDGTPFPTLMNAMIIKDDNDAPRFIYSTSLDMTLIKQAEEEVKKFRMIADKANYGNAIADLDGTLLYCNESFAKMHGYEISALLGKNLSALHSAEQLTVVGSFIRLLKEKGEFQAAEIWRRRKDGSEFPSLMNAMIVRDNDNNPQFMWATAIDITQQKAAEEVIRKSEERLNAAQLISGMGSWEYDFINNKSSWSKNFYNLLGMDSSLPPLSLDEVRALVHPEDLEAYIENLNRTIPSGGREPSQFRMRMNDGNFKWVDSYIIPVVKDGVLISVSGVTVDITAKKLAEDEIKKLTIAIEQSPVSIVITDLNAIIQYVSPAFYQTTGYTASEVIGKNIGLLKSGQTPREDYEKLWYTIGAGKVWQNEWVNKKKNGELYWESISITPVFNASGVVTNYLAIKQDISERKKAEQEISDLNVNLERRIDERTKELADKNTELVSEIEMRKAFEEALKSKTEELETFFSVTIDLMSISDMNGNLIKLNKAWEEVLGYTVEEIASKKFMEFIHPDDQNMSFEELGRLSQDLPVRNFVNRYKTKNGSYKFIEWHTVKSGDLIYSAARDITERINSEKYTRMQRDFATELNAISDLRKALYLSIETAQKLEDIDSGGVYLLNNETNTLDLAAYSGLSEDFVRDHTSYTMDSPQARLVLAGNPVYGGFGELAPDKTPEEKRESVRGLAVIPIKFEGKVIGGLNIASKTSPEFPERIHGPIEVIAQQIGLAISRIYAKNELFASKQNFQLLFNTIDDFLFILDAEGKIVTTNPVVKKRLGFTEEELRQMHLLGVHPPERRDEAGFIVGEMLAGRAAYCPVPLCTKDGELIPVETRVILGEWDAKPALFGISRDMTERKRYEDQILAARNEAEKANMAKSEFLSRMSHELRTPMNSILGFAQLLEMGVLNPGQKKGVGHILRSGTHLLELINEVLDITRIEAGKISISLEPVEATGIIGEMTDTVAPLARERNIKIQLLDAPPSGIYVRSDRQRLKQVILNLLNNAIKYNVETGSVQIKIAEMPVNENGVAPVRISVTDTGSGIPADDLPKLFTPFERIGAEKTATEGTGLGLAVTKKLVDLMGGRIGVESVKGTGTTFWIELPPGQRELDRVTQSGELTGEIRKTKTKGGTVLYIEDNISNIELVEQILFNSRPAVKLITNMYGKQSIEIARQHKPDLILLDLNLPDLHGSEVMEQLREADETSSIPVVIITADATPAQSEKMLKAGAEEYLTKPLNVELFLSVLDRYLK